MKGWNELIVSCARSYSPTHTRLEFCLLAMKVLVSNIDAELYHCLVQSVVDYAIIMLDDDGDIVSCTA